MSADTGARSEAPILVRGRYDRHLRALRRIAALDSLLAVIAAAVLVLWPAARDTPLSAVLGLWAVSMLAGAYAYWRISGWNSRGVAP